MLPILERLLYKPKSQPVSRVLVLVPTRELAVQVHQVTKQLSQYTRVNTALAAGKQVFLARAPCRCHNIIFFMRI